jgi:L-fuconolactonase
MTATRRIDAHQHFWRIARGDYGWLTPAQAPIHRDFGPRDLAPCLRATGMAATVLVQAAPTVAETEFLLALAAETPFVAGVVGWAPLDAFDAPDLIARLAQDGRLRGLRPMIHDIPDVDWMLGPALTPALRALAALDLTFDALVRPPHLRNLLVLLERHPDLRVVIDHGGKPEIAARRIDPWAADLRALARNTGAFVKLSGLCTEAGPDWTVDRLRPYVAHLLDAFGPERMLFGSDWPVLTLAARYEDWFRATETLLQDLDPAARARIYGETATRAYRL